MRTPLGELKCVGVIHLKQYLYLYISNNNIINIIIVILYRLNEKNVIRF